MPAIASARLPTSSPRLLLICSIAAISSVSAWKLRVSMLRVKAVSRTSGATMRSEEHTSELQSLMRISYAVFCLKKKKETPHNSANPLYDTNPLTESHCKKQITNYHPRIRLDHTTT